jgi:hypothetical protein
VVGGYRLMPTEDQKPDPANPVTILQRTINAVDSNQQQPWYAKTVHVAVSVASVTAFVLYTSRSIEMRQEGVIIMGTALVLIVYAFGGDGMRIVSRFLGKKD